MSLKRSTILLFILTVLFFFWGLNTALAQSDEELSENILKEIIINSINNTAWL
ncbi:nitrogen fixation-related uncharacterized protein [Pedobacter sp. UYP24]